MGLADSLRRAGNYLRDLRQSRGPDGYWAYRREREIERKAADDARDRAKDSAGRERDKAEHERQYEERYRHERNDEIARERTGRADEPGPGR